MLLITISCVTVDENNVALKEIRLALLVVNTGAQVSHVPAPSRFIVRVGVLSELLCMVTTPL